MGINFGIYRQKDLTLTFTRPHHSYYQDGNLRRVWSLAAESTACVLVNESRYDLRLDGLG